MATTGKEGFSDKCIQTPSGNSSKEEKRQRGRENKKPTISLRGELVPPLKTEKRVCEFLKTLCKSKKYRLLGSSYKKEIQLFRMSSGVTSMGGRILRFGRKGIADFLLFDSQNNPVWVECKAPGKFPSDDQTEFSIKQEQERVNYYCFDGKRIMFPAVTSWLQDKDKRKNIQCGDFSFNLVKEIPGAWGWFSYSPTTKREIFNILINRCENITED